MDTRKIVIATSFFSAVLVLSAVVPLGYFGFQLLTEKLEAGQSQVQSVIIELKTEALEEIQAAAKQVADGGADNGAESGSQSDTAVMATLEELKTSVNALRTDQRRLAEDLKRSSGTAMPVASVAPSEPSEETLDQTVFFPMGKIDGPMIDQQVTTAMSRIAEYGRNRACVSNVMGYSDTLGGDKSNLELSQKRAEHVAKSLRDQDVPVGDVKGWGERRLKVHTIDGVQNEQNRRVVIETECNGPVQETTEAVS